MTANKVWLIVSGEYSDYQVHCGFVSEDLAVAYAAAINRITVDEQREILKIQVLPYPLYTHVVANLPARLREIVRWAHCAVEVYDLFDDVPVVDAEASS